MRTPFGCLHPRQTLLVLAIALFPISVCGAGPQQPGTTGHGRYSPKMLAYSAQPNAYFNDRAEEVARIYQGFFFNVGTWDEGATAKLGITPDGATVDTEWKDLARQNLAALCDAGAAENFLTVCFGDSGAWPSPETLLTRKYSDTMARQFSAIAKTAKELGFRGIAVDVEYPYPRYALDNSVYTYEGYTAEDLLDAASVEGRAVMSAMLDAFPEAVIGLLPGSMWSRPIVRRCQLGMLETMAERDAPGGLHLFSERAYSLLDPLSQVAIPCEGDLAVHALVHDKATLAYWHRRCSVAPGVWPLHMIETGGKDYSVRPWPEELAELRQQMEILRSLAKRYIWSFSGMPVWHPYTPEVAEKYHLGTQPFEHAAEVVTEWHSILADHGRTTDPRVLRLAATVERFDKGEVTAADLCHAFGTPGDWMVLGPLANPFVAPAFAAQKALLEPIRPDVPIAGRDNVVRWFLFHNYEPLGSVRVMGIFDWYKTDLAAVHLASTIEAQQGLAAVMHFGWDDGAAVWLSNKLVLDRRTYPERGHGKFSRDRYDFEESVPVTLRKGENALRITCINQKGNWGVNIRFTDQDGWPLAGVTFSVPKP